MTTNIPTPEESFLKILSFGTPEQQRVLTRGTDEVSSDALIARIDVRTLHVIVQSNPNDLSKADLSRAVRTDPHACVDYCVRHLRPDNDKPRRLRRFEDVIATDAGAIARYATHYLKKRWTSKEEILKKNLKSNYVAQYVTQFSKNHYADSCQCWMCEACKKKS